MKYARMIGNIAVEVVELPEGMTPADAYHKDIASQFQQVPDTVVAGASYDVVKDEWNFPAPTGSSATSQDPQQIALAVVAVSLAIDTKRDQLIAAGKPHDFPDGKHGTVQLRNDRDRTSVNALATAGTVLLLTGDTTSMVSFRDDENVTHDLSGAQAAKFGVDVLAWISQRYDAAWRHKDALAMLAAKEGTSVGDIMTYDYRSGWVN